MTTKPTPATDATDNGEPPATDGTSETDESTDSSTETDETDETDDSTPPDDAERLKFYQRKARENEQELKKLRKAEEERQRAEMSELDRLKADNEKLSAELEEQRVDAIKARLATKHNLDAELVDRLRGDTEEELAADAERLAELVGKAKPPTPPPPGDAGMGGGVDKLPTDPIALSRRFTGKG